MSEEDQGPALFDVPESLSPKAAWKRDNMVISLPPGAKPGETGDAPTTDLGWDASKWVTWIKGESPGKFWQGSTEEEALFDMALELNLEFYK